MVLICTLNVVDFALDLDADQESASHGIAVHICRYVDFDITRIYLCNLRAGVYDGFLSCYFPL